MVLTFGQEMPLRTLLIVSEGFSHPTLNRGRQFCPCLINALIAKGKCYSQLIHMLGTKTVQQRLAQLLLVLSEHHVIVTEGIAIDRQITHQETADIVGSTRHGERYASWMEKA